MLLIPTVSAKLNDLGEVTDPATAQHFVRSLMHSPGLSRVSASQMLLTSGFRDLIMLR